MHTKVNGEWMLRLADNFQKKLSTIEMQASEKESAIGFAVPLEVLSVLLSDMEQTWT